MGAGGGEAALPPPRGAPRAAVVPAPPPSRSSPRLPGMKGSAPGAAATSPVFLRIAVKRAPPAAREGNGNSPKGAGTPTGPALGATAAPLPAGALTGVEDYGVLAAPAGLLTASRCCGGCSSGRRAAPARDSPRCSPSRSTAPGTAAAPPRPPSPATAPGTG